MAYSFRIGLPRASEGEPVESPDCLEDEARSESADVDEEKGSEEEDDWETVLEKAREAPPSPTSTRTRRSRKEAVETYRVREDRRYERSEQRENRYAQWEAWIQSAWNAPPDDPTQEQRHPSLPFTSKTYDLHPPHHLLPTPPARESRAAIARREALANRPRPEPLLEGLFRVRPARDDSPDFSPPDHHPLSQQRFPCEAWRAESRLLPPPLQPIPFPPTLHHPLIDLGEEDRTADLLGLNLPSPAPSSTPPAPDPFDILTD